MQLRCNFDATYIDYKSGTKIGVEDLLRYLETKQIYASDDIKQVFVVIG